MEYIAEIRADLNGYPGPEKLIFKQGDFADRYVLVTLTKDGSPVQIGSDVTPRIHMEKPDGKQVITDINVEIMEDGALKIQILPQMSSAAGPGRLEIALYRQGAYLSTAAIDVLIYPSALSMVVVASSHEYQALIDALAQIAPAIAAEEERKRAESERIANETARKEAEEKRQDAYEDMLEATDYAETQGDYAKAQGDYAGAQGDYAKGQTAVIQDEFGKIESLLESAESGEVLQKVLKLLEDLYDIATDIDIDKIIEGTYVDEDDEGSIFESGSPEDIDEIIGGTYVEDTEDEPGETVTPEDIDSIIKDLFAA